VTVGGTGGRGVVILRHPETNKAGTVTGGGVPSLATIGGVVYRIYTFNTSGTISWS
jgi:hypothetical protein